MEFSLSVQSTVAAHWSSSKSGRPVMAPVGHCFRVHTLCVNESSSGATGQHTMLLVFTGKACHSLAHGLCLLIHTFDTQGA